MRYVNCARCGKEIREGDKAVRHRYLTGFHCSFRCFALDHEASETEVTDELVCEDEESSGFGWNTEGRARD